MMGKEYLGDGVYVRLIQWSQGECGGVVLTTENGTEVPTNVIYMEMDVLNNFMKFKETNIGQ